MQKQQSPIAPPSQFWQERGSILITDCQATLWSPQGAKALDWLRSQGLHDETIQIARLGYNSSVTHEPPETWGLTGKKIYLPRGIVIPNEYVENLWGIRFRLPAVASAEQKYIAVRDTVPALYGSANLSHEKPAILVGGEFDALTIQQHVPEVIAVATGSISWCRKMKWLALLARSPLVLVAYDNNEAGEKAAQWWIEALGASAKRWRPWWEDVNALCRDGADLRVWLAPALAENRK